MLMNLFAFALGAAIGSFLNVVIRRLPLGQSIVYPPSHCPNCNYPISWYDNMPILSWIILAAKCRNCGGKISYIYPAIELLTAILFAMTLSRYGFSAQFAISAAFIACMIAVAFIDVEHLIIPNSITLPGTLVGFAASFIAGGTEPLSSLI